MVEVIFTKNYVRFIRYDFPCASIYASGDVAVWQIRDAYSQAGPPEIRTTLGEILFIPAGQRQELEEFCRHNGIANQRRSDVWSDLLEPFLDTCLDPEHQAKTLNRLNQVGLPPDEVADIRRRVGPLMRAYNLDSGLWDWASLNLFDLLNAAVGVLVPPDLPPTLGDPHDFYAWAMRIAGHGRVIDLA